MTTTTRRNTDRRQEIIDAAFVVAADKPDWSLADVAARIGVSKTALYRHFRNRAEIEALMDERLVDALAAAIETSGPDAKSLRAEAMRLFRERQGYLHRVMVRSSENGDYADALAKKLMAKSPKAAAFVARFESLPDAGQTTLEITVIKNWISILIASFPAQDAERLRDGLLMALENGMPTLGMPDEGRLDALERISETEAGETGERSRLFSAIAASIREYGVKGTTIETIAKKMGTAKSSLYFYSPNKEDMLSGLLDHETRALDALCDARAAEGATLAEQLFIVMMTHANYLIANPDIAPAFNWIRYEIMHDGPKGPPSHGCEGHSIGAYRFGELFPADDAAGKRYAALTLKWASMLGISCAMRGFERHADARTIRKNVRIMFKSMIDGDKNRR